MKDRLTKLRNVFPNNPTQTAYFRFLKTPYLPLHTSFSDSLDRFSKYEDSLKTVYEKYVGQL